jgi:hypothetical protein
VYKAPCVVRYVTTKVTTSGVVYGRSGASGALARDRSDLGDIGRNCLAMIVSTERLGRPSEESGRFERHGFVQKRLVYPLDSDTPTATCHVQRSAREPALFGYQLEGLIAVPGSPSFEEIEDSLRCERCATLIASLGA